ncbi:MAG: gatC [Nevskia sp.]|nr:gatC [Nevskia sp.]
MAGGLNSRLMGEAAQTAWVAAGTSTTSQQQAFAKAGREIVYHQIITYFPGYFVGIFPANARRLAPRLDWGRRRPAEPDTGLQDPEPPMSLSPEQIRQVAQLARLQLAPEQTEHYARQLSNILAMVDQLSRADTEGVAPMAHPLDMVQRLRPDVVSETNQREALQAIAPQVADGVYLVPRVIE